MSVRRIVPNVFEEDPAKARAFWEDVFELDVAMDMGWIATLVSPVERAAQVSVFEQNSEDARNPFVSLRSATSTQRTRGHSSLATRWPTRFATRTGE